MAWNYLTHWDSYLSSYSYSRMSESNIMDMLFFCGFICGSISFGVYEYFIKSKFDESAQKILDVLVLAAISWVFITFGLSLIIGF